MESAIARSSTAEEQEKSNPDNVKDNNVVLSERHSCKVSVRLLPEQRPVDDWHDDCSCCSEALIPTKFRPLITSDEVELFSTIIRKIS